MARRAPTPKKTKAPPASPPAEDLAILHPNRELAIAGELITVNEYGFALGLRLQSVLIPLVNSLADLVERGLIGSYDAVISTFGEHADQVEVAIGASIGRTPEWVGGLSDADGSLLIDTWWMVNQPFFLRRVRTTLGIRMEARSRSHRRATEAAAGQTSTPS